MDTFEVLRFHYASFHIYMSYAYTFLISTENFNALLLHSSYLKVVRWQSSHYAVRRFSCTDSKASNQMGIWYFNTMTRK